MIEPQAEALIAATGADFRIGGARAYYNTTSDFVQVPPPAAYFEPIVIEPPSTSLVIGQATPAASAEIIPVCLGRNPTRAKNWSPKWRARSYAPRSASFRPFAMPTTSARGSRCCAGTIVPSCAQRARHRRRPIMCSRLNRRCPMT
jgi:Zincin-like metallopeptidase